MPKQRDPDLDMLTAIELRLRDNQEEMITLACAVCVAQCTEVMLPAGEIVEHITVRYSVQKIAQLMLACDITRRFDPDTSEWVLDIVRKPDPNQPELTSNTERLQ